ncbi:hypothetical protein OAT18_03760, partial [Tenacibaculum sp.]|nr:hypothetical protein [Tenacibaculum sp.]
MKEYIKNFKFGASFLFFIFMTQVGFSQKEPSKNEIKVIARPHASNKIMLRWASNTPMSFRKLSKYGYQLKRYTISISEQTLPAPIIK